MAKRLVWVPFACAALALVSADAAALPTPYNVVASVDDAYLGLRLVTDRIQGDSRSLCGVHIEVTDTLVPLTAGDRVYLAVYEDDLAGDDELWTYDFAVTAAEVSAGFVWRDFDCSGDFGEDVAGGLEIYATARVEKAACTGFCVWDRPETRAVALTDLADDEAEDDDTIDTANPATAGTTESRIATDADHHRFELTGGSNVEVTVAFDATVGAVDVDLLDGAGVLIASAFDTDTGASLVRTLDAGTYFVRTTPRAAPDFNFYDLRVDLSLGDVHRVGVARVRDVRRPDARLRGRRVASVGRLRGRGRVLARRARLARLRGRRDRGARLLGRVRVGRVRCLRGHGHGRRRRDVGRRGRGRAAGRDRRWRRAGGR